MADDRSQSSQGPPEREVQSFQDIVNLYKERVYRTALRLTQNHEDALDISQETFLRIFRQSGRWKPGGAFSSWVYRITVNLCIDLLRSRTRRRTVRIEQAVRITVSEPSGSDNPERAAQMRELRERIEDALGSLPPRQKAVFVLRHYQGLSLREIASVLGCREGTVKAHLFRATGRLRDVLARETD